MISVVKPSVDNPLSDPHTIMSDPDPQPSSSYPIHSENHHDSNHTHNENEDKANVEKKDTNYRNGDAKNSTNYVVRRERPARECTKRAAARLQAAAAAEVEAEAAAVERKRKAAARKGRLAARLLRDEEDEIEKSEEFEDEEGEEGEGVSPSSSRQQCSKIVTPLVGEPEPSQLPRWNLRSMWQLASILNFLHVFRPLLNINVDISAEEFETALISPNNTLGDIHMPLLKAIPPITRMALGHNTWITVLCRKLRDWWHWVAEGEIPVVVSHGAEIEAYNALDPAVRVVILKAICDIRVEQEDIRNYIDDSVKQGVHLSLFRKDRIGGDSHGVSYWYEDDDIIGHRLYREIRKVEIKKGKGKNVQQIPNSCYEWETVATNLDEFLDVSEKLFSSKNRTEASVGKKLKNGVLAEIEKVHKMKEKLLKKQNRQALMLDNMLNMDGLATGRSMRGRKPVTYTFDDYDRSINEAIKITKNKQPSPEPTLRREADMKHETSKNGRWGNPSQISQRVSFRVQSPKSPEYDESDEELNDELLDRSNRRRQRPQRYSAKEFVEAVSDNEADLDSDDDIVGEAVYDEEYLRKRKKQRKISSSSEGDGDGDADGDEEYNWDEENPEDEEEEEEDEDSASGSEESDEPQRFKKLPGRTRRETKLRSVQNLQSGLRRSKRATRNHVNYSRYEMSESENESMKPEKSNASDEHYDSSDDAEFSMASEDEEENNDNQEMKVEQPVDEPSEIAKNEQNDMSEKPNSPDEDEFEGGPRKRRFLDLNELAPGSGYEDGPSSVMKDEGEDDV